MKYLLPVERVAAVYFLLTSVLMLVLLPRLVNPVGMLVMRAEWLSLTVALVVAHRLFARYFPDACFTLFSFPVSLRGTLFPFLRVVLQMVWLGMWYPDTYEFNRSFPNLDHLFAAAEQQLFGCQPSLLFCEALPHPFWSEAFHLGYWSYFPMIFLLTLALFWREFMAPKPAVAFTPAAVRQSQFVHVSTLILTSFFLFYAIYIFLPVAGPQFYFRAVGTDTILAGHFPPIGTYFSSHTDMLPSPGNSDGLFYHFVSSTRDAGERPTAAFPSSHIGISTILMLLTRRYFPRLLPFLLPFWVLLCGATVYIRAHYVIDAIAGLISAPLILLLAQTLNSPKLCQEVRTNRSADASTKVS